MTASVTFGNVNGHISPASHISLHVQQERAEPVVETTPTRRCRWRQECGSGGGVTHRGSSFSRDEEEVDVRGEGVGGENDDDDMSTQPSTRSLFHLEICCLIF